MLYCRLSVTLLYIFFCLWHKFWCIFITFLICQLLRSYGQFVLVFSRINPWIYAQKDNVEVPNWKTSFKDKFNDYTTKSNNISLSRIKKNWKHTVCPRSCQPFYIVNNSLNYILIKSVSISWTHSMLKTKEPDPDL